MLSKEQTIAEIINNQAEETEWAGKIIERIENRFSAGYLTAKLEELGDSMSSSDNDYKHYLLEYCQYDIWDGGMPIN